MGYRGSIFFRDPPKRNPAAIRGILSQVATKTGRMFYLALGFLIGAGVVLAVAVYYWVMDN